MTDPASCLWTSRATLRKVRVAIEPHVYTHARATNTLAYTPPLLLQISTPRASTRCDYARATASLLRVLTHPLSVPQVAARRFCLVAAGAP